MSEPSSSRKRFRDYLDRFKKRLKSGELARGGSPHGHAPGHTPGDAPGRPAKPHKRQRSFAQLFRAFLSQSKGHNRMLLFALIGATVATLLGLIPLYGTKVIFDNVLDNRPLPAATPGWIDQADHKTLLLIVCGTMVIFAVVSLCVSMWSRWHATRITKRIQVGVRRTLFDQAVRLPLHRVYEMKSGGVASTLREDAGSVGDLVFAMLYNPWRAIVQLVGSLCILALTDWKLLLGSLILLPVIFISVKAWISRIRPMFREIRNTRSTIDGHATEAFGGIRVVRGFGRQRSEAKRFVGGNHFMARQELYVWWWNRAVDIAFSILIPVSSAALLLYGGWQILDDRVAVDAGTLAAASAFTTGDLVMFLAYLGWLLGPLAVLAESATAFQNGLAGLDRVLDLMQEPTEFATNRGSKQVSPAAVQGHIAVRNLSFTYPGGDHAVLNDINLQVPAGAMVALVGPSGAGKTTLSNLIARFYDPTQGRIELDGVDLKDIELDSYRRLLGIVEQDIFLFDGTIGENIGYAGRDVTEDDVIEAAKLANAHRFIKAFPQGYHTLIGERGVKLSGGQRQRIAIARAILADPRILILDEATSNLDSESERLIQDSLHTLMRGRTTFVIAHRLSTIADADLIVVIDDGRIIEQGRHDELMKRFGRYQEMVELQTRRVDRQSSADDPAASAPSR
ncbi:MAG: ABC transporter ATP-binding protein [Phycisphaeraceae bacterium]